MLMIRIGRSTSPASLSPPEVAAGAGVAAGVAAGGGGGGAVDAGVGRGGADGMRRLGAPAVLVGLVVLAGLAGPGAAAEVTGVDVTGAVLSGVAALVARPAASGAALAAESSELS
jgi:hypothetical protein